MAARAGMAKPERGGPDEPPGRREPSIVTLRSDGSPHGAVDRDMPADRHAAARGIALGLLVATILWAVILAALYALAV